MSTFMKVLFVIFKVNRRSNPHCNRRITAALSQKSFGNEMWKFIKRAFGTRKGECEEAYKYVGERAGPTHPPTHNKL